MSKIKKKDKVTDEMQCLWRIEGKLEDLKRILTKELESLRGDMEELCEKVNEVLEKEW